jgi:hypothetical protein
LEKPHVQVKQHQRSQDDRIAKALQKEEEQRTAVEGERAEEITRISTDI